MEQWRKVFRIGLAPLLSTEELLVLSKALEEDDPRLIQGATTIPPPLWCVRDWPVEATCILGYCGWRGDGLETVAEVEEFFARMCFEIDQRLGEPAGCRWFLNFWDETPRQKLRRLMIPEVQRALNLRDYIATVPQHPLHPNLKEPPHERRGRSDHSRTDRGAYTLTLAFKAV